MSMESKRYQKTGIITLFGFIIFSLIVIWLVNVYFIGEKDYKKREIDMQLSKEILLNSKAIDKVLTSMQRNLRMQRDWLEKTFENREMNLNRNLLSKTIYLEEENITIIDENKIQDISDYGNLIIQGKASILNQEIQNEINILSEFFKLENILHNQLDFDMNYIYYSTNDYVTYYPYVEIGKREVNYQKLFLNVDALIERILIIDSENEDFDPTLGWDIISVDEGSPKNLLFTTIMPVVVNDEITGILTGTINGNVFTDLFNDKDEKTNIYLIDANESIVYTNNLDVERMSNISDVFLQQYKVKYYQNKFPTPLEIRNEKNHTLYISELSRDNWYLTYVYDNKNHFSTVRIIVYNILMFIMLVCIVLMYVRFGNKKKSNEDSIIKNSKYDGMTELLNQKHIIEMLKRYLRNIRIKQLSIIMMDIDNFKSINDSHGHSVGDQVICISAKIIKEILYDKIGNVGRYGGDKFLIITTKVSEQETLELVEQIRVRINEAIYEELGINVTISMGLHHIIKPIQDSAIDLINKTSQKLNIAKENRQKSDL